MVRATAAFNALLLSATTGPEAVEVRDQGIVDITTFECHDTPRSTVIQRACYDQAEAILIVNFKGTYRQYCALPVKAFEAFMTAPSMGQFYKTNIEGADAERPYDCRANRDPVHHSQAHPFEPASVPLMFLLPPHLYATFDCV